jgi:uncharacterized DUF497 family protein
MRFLADENIPGDAVAEIEAAGHDIVWVRTVAPGSKDEDVLAWAVREERIILTFDKDFGELAWCAGLPASSGIVLDYAARIFLNPTLEKQDDRRDYGEVRMQAIGQVGEDVLFVVYTDRNAHHIISARLASRKERKSWHSFVEQWRTSGG